jgi:hypothetical protein
MRVGAVQVYGEIFRTLKPGCSFGSFEWCVTDKFDLKNPEHLDIKKVSLPGVVCSAWLMCA